MKPQPLMTVTKRRPHQPRQTREMTAPLQPKTKTMQRQKQKMKMKRPILLIKKTRKARRHQKLRKHQHRIPKIRILKRLPAVKTIKRGRPLKVMANTRRRDPQKQRKSKHRHLQIKINQQVLPPVIR